MKKVFLFFKYILALFVCPKQMAEAVNVAGTEDELDEIANSLYK